MLSRAKGSKVHQHSLESGGVAAEEYMRGRDCTACGKGFSEGESYSWCRICFAKFHELCGNLPLVLNNFLHPSCPLSLQSGFYGYCSFCFHLTTRLNYEYGCESCDFHMHVECATTAQSLSITSESKSILHCCHHHPLQPLPFNPKCLLSCQICNLPCSLEVGPVWGCEPCYFHLHKSCLDLLPQIVQNLPPNSWVLTRSPDRRCIECYKTSDLVYIRQWKHDQRLRIYCVGCCLVYYYSQQPKVIDHYFHPCTLKLAFSPFRHCNACLQQNNQNFFFHCSQCDFFLDLDCAQLPNFSLVDESTQMYHFCHWHPLIPFEEGIDLICRLCEYPYSCSKSFYGCTKCQFYVHKLCLDRLPQETIHPHLKKIMVLLTIPSYECASCNRTCSWLAFHCIETKKKFCVKCILWHGNEFGNSKGFISIHHKHQLTIGDIERVHKNTRCFMCDKRCLDWIYECKECGIYFHKTCAELSRKLWHPSHHHPLTLKQSRFSSEVSEVVRCKLCLQTLSRRSSKYSRYYGCEAVNNYLGNCDFSLDSRCASLLPSIEYQGHPHFLYVLDNFLEERPRPRPRCRSCNKFFPRDFPMLHCAECDDFNLHLECGPLPCKIKDVPHVHPLTLQEYYVEDNTSDEFACHVCEQPRDPREPAYVKKVA